MTSPVYNNDILLSLTSSVNLMCIPPNIIRQLEARIQAASSTATGLDTPALLRVAQVELSFLLAKESVHVCSDSTVDSISSNKIFTVVQVNNVYYYSGINDMFQEYFVRLMLLFLNTCPHFQTLPPECKATLLR